MDMPLDDLIKSNRRGRGGRRGGGNDNRTGGGAFRRARNSQRNNPYKSNRGGGNSDGVWEHDRFDDEEEEEEIIVETTRTFSSGGAGLETGAKLLITNLAFSVNDDDIKDLFEPLGEVKKAFVKYDKSDRSEGTATVVYARKASALEAIKKYNNVPLDGQPMKISLVSTTGGSGGNGGGRVQRQQGGDGGARSFRKAVSDAERVTINVRNPRATGGRRVVVGRTGGRGRGGRGGNGGRGGSGGRGGRGGRASGGRQVPTKEELDAEMDEYAAAGDE